MEEISKNSELRQKSRDVLSGKWGMAILFYVVYSVLVGVIGLVFGSMHYVGNVATILIMIPITWGIVVMYLRLSRGDVLDIKNIFDGFKDFTRVFCTMFLTNLQLFLWTLLLIVPGIVKSYSYAMVPYILADTGASNVEAIHESRIMMSGHKMRLFLMDLWFVIISLFSVILLFIPLLWIMPYWYTARAMFYINVKGYDKNSGNGEL